MQIKMQKLKNLKSYLLIIATLAICFQEVRAQDPIFTQFYANPLYLNPALAGTHGCPRFNLNYRNQWPALSANFVTYSASYDQYFDDLNGGIGIIAMHDQQGQNTINETNLSLIYSYHLKVNRKFSLLFGGQATYAQRFLDWNKLTFGDMIDPRRGFIYQTGDVPRGGSRGFFDVSAGVVGFTKDFYFGVAAHHLNTPNQSMINGENSFLPMRITGHVGADIPLSKSKYHSTTSLSPNIIYRYQEGFMELNIGTYVKYNVFTAGVWFRSRDAFILTFGINTGSFRLGYSYDVTVSKITNQSGGSHEVSLGLNLNCSKKPISYKTISCPSF